MQKILWFYESMAKLRMETFSNGVKVNIYAYANKMIENNEFLNDFWHFWKKFKDIGWFWIKQGPFT